MTQEAYKILECLNCGEIMPFEGSFCSDECEREYNYTNRTCPDCGGEFWDGGTSCTCDDFEVGEDNVDIQKFESSLEDGDELPF